MADLKPSVAVSGASSFTGLWICRELARRGWQVHALMGSDEEAYVGLRKRRIEMLDAPSIERWFSVRAENGSMDLWIRERCPTIWIHHHHPMEEFRSPSYDMERARREGLEPLPRLLDALKESECRGIVSSGTYFEDAALTPYARSKAEVWVELQSQAKRVKLPLSKVVMPNPIGPLENDDRLIPQLARAAKEHKPFELRSPGAVGDQLPVTTLARVYRELCDELNGGGGGRVARPSGWVGPVGAFARQVQEELIRRRLGLEPAKLIEGTEKGPAFQNPPRERETVNWSEVWDHYAANCMLR